MRFNTIADGLVAPSQGRAGYVCTCGACRAFEEWDVYPSYGPNREMWGRLYVARSRPCTCKAKADAFAYSPEQERARANGKLGAAKRAPVDPAIRQVERDARDAKIFAMLEAGESQWKIAARLNISQSTVSLAARRFTPDKPAVKPRFRPGQKRSAA